MQVQGVVQHASVRSIEVRATKQTTHAPQPESQAAPPAPATTDEAQKGVIRLLQEGHFKGVADVRLRINFHEELQALQRDSDAQHAQEVLEKLPPDVQAAIDVFLAENPLEEELQAAFNALHAEFESAITALIDGDVEGDPADALSAAFQTFIDEVTALLAPAGEPESVPLEAVDATPTEQPVVETVETLEPQAQTEEPETLTPLQQFVESLQALLQEALADLNDAPSLLPPLSEPTGNGGAYAKFLAMYHELNGIGPAEASEPALNVTS